MWLRKRCSAENVATQGYAVAPVFKRPRTGLRIMIDLGGPTRHGLGEANPAAVDRGMDLTTL